MMRIQSRLSNFMRIVLLGWLLLSIQSVQAGDWKTESLQVTDAEIPLQILPASTTTRARMVWLPSEYGILSQERVLAEHLSEMGVESWMADFYEALFAAPTPSSLEQIPATWIKILIDKSLEDGVPVWILAPNRAAKLALDGLVLRSQEGMTSAPGVILLNPNLYVQTPQPGEAAVYWSQVDAANLTVTVLQSELSPWRWRLTELAQHFANGGSDVFLQMLPKVRDRFYFRPDAMPIEQRAASHLAQTITRAMYLQLPYLSKARPLLNSAALEAKTEVQADKKSLDLQPYKGQQSLALSLFDLEGSQHDLKALQGKVVLVNFWASWCPPCVHEMPSMADLKRRYRDANFEILAVNLGEEVEAIDQFKAQHPVNFPILLDQDGVAVKEWKIFAYPSSYVVDKNGRIRYALFGATDWMQQDTLQKIGALLDEKR
ncbi:TlpA disulfide reductase family protein [Thiomicrorhabdus sp.]|uniref:TlpA disulfide reductase family protein n=1 Tax=Thiomicrorhabdus sp. TaxID=2039724 RepID=UPI0029C8D119|nr:TlpA disulfide reductase family protein [Thiomicrorhabdus sp.]